MNSEPLTKHKLGQLPTGKYRDIKPANWLLILARALENPRLTALAQNYVNTGHPSCLNAILDQQESSTWLAASVSESHAIKALAEKHNLELA